MAKVPIALRLTPEALTEVDAHAKSRAVSRQVILESAVLSWLGDAEGGVPDLPEEARVVRPQPAVMRPGTPRAELKRPPAPRIKGVKTAAELMFERQQKLNEGRR